ncbi:g2711 [Coccomyxa viridis]|uniref:G2711 protein n=1 Tax=Coccomyxa viridis TaxID=1274662 RepID=A0ABP1FQ23_9CHLO
MNSAEHSVFAETQQFFIKQRAAIGKLRADNEALKEEMQLENKFSVRPTSSAAAATIESLRQQSDACTQKIGTERARVADLQRRAAQAQAQVEEQRRKMGGLRAAQDCDIQLEKTMTQLENRLDKAIKRLNTRQAETRTLRDNIDGLRKERLALNEALAKLDGQLSAQRQDAARLLRISQSECMGRDKALASIAATRLAGDREVANAEAEWRQLLQLIQQDRKQREVQRGKQLAERAQSTSKLLREDIARGARRASRADGAAADAGEDPSGVASLNKRLEDYAAAFNQISTATGTSGVDALVAVMNAKEDSNFRLFSYVGDINSEAEKLQAHADDVQKELDRYQAAADAQDSERQAKLQALEEQGTEAEAEADSAESREVAAAVRSEALKEGVTLMWQRLGCEVLGLEELLGDGGVTDTNLMQYLGIIEQRVNQLLLEAKVTPAEGTEAAEVEQGPAATQNTTGDKAEGGWDIMKLLPSIYGDPTPTGDPALPAVRKQAQESVAARIADARNETPAAPLPRSRYNTTSVRRAPALMRGRPMAKPTQQRR